MSREEKIMKMMSILQKLDNEYVDIVDKSVEACFTVQTIKKAEIENLEKLLHNKIN